MKSLRRSLNTRDHHHHPTISSPISHAPLSRPVPAVVPPKVVIRALVDYRATNPQELNFSKGDFFYVLNDNDRGDGWYEAHNPITGSRGLVPRSGFEVFTKGGAMASVKSVYSVFLFAPPAYPFSISPIILVPVLPRFRVPRPLQFPSSQTSLVCERFMQSYSLTFPPSAQTSLMRGPANPSLSSLSLTASGSSLNRSVDSAVPVLSPSHSSRLEIPPVGSKWRMKKWLG